MQKSKFEGKINDIEFTDIEKFNEYLKDPNNDIKSVSYQYNYIDEEEKPDAVRDSSKLENKANVDDLIDTLNGYSVDNIDNLASTSYSDSTFIDFLPRYTKYFEDAFKTLSLREQQKILEVIKTKYKEWQTALEANYDTKDSITEKIETCKKQLENYQKTFNYLNNCEDYLSDISAFFNNLYNFLKGNISNDDTQKELNDKKQPVVQGHTIKEQLETEIGEKKKLDDFIKWLLGFNRF